MRADVDLYGEADRDFEAASGEVQLQLVRAIAALQADATPATTFRWRGRQYFAKSLEGLNLTYDVIDDTQEPWTVMLVKFEPTP